MTKDEFVQQTLMHLATQGRRALVPSGDTRCSYRGANGTKCAIGFWIPDEKYDPNMEGNAASIHLVWKALPVEVTAGVGNNFLNMVQACVHDQMLWTSVEIILSLWRQFANDYDLTIDWLPIEAALSEHFVSEAPTS